MALSEWRRDESHPLKSGFAGPDRGDTMMKFLLDFLRAEAQQIQITTTHVLDIKLIGNMCSVWGACI